jgi:hypothetical protein
MTATPGLTTERVPLASLKWPRRTYYWRVERAKRLTPAGRARNAERARRARARLSAEDRREVGRRDLASRPYAQVKAAIGRCQLCGYDRYLGALDWHHLKGNGGGKRRPDIRKYGPARFAEAIKDCLLICSNCHKEVHAGLREAAA